MRMWCLSVARKELGSNPRGRLTPATVSRRLVLSLAALAVIGAAVVVRSGSAPKRTDPTIAKPQAVLFAVRGTPQDPVGPGLAAFIAVINPQQRTIGMVPVPGTLNTPEGTLAEVAPTASAQTIAQDVSAEMRVKLTGYLVLDAGMVSDIVTTLAQEAPGWPPELTPDQALADLGWPGAMARPKAAVAVVQDLIQYLPDITGNANRLLVAKVLLATNSDLGPYQMFVVVTYINDEHVVPMDLRSLPASLREKQVKR